MSDTTPPTGPDRLLTFVRQERAREKLAERLVRAHQMGGRIEFKRALDLRAVIADVQASPHDLHDRFQSLYRAPEIALAIWRACQGDPACLRALRDQVEGEGALLEGKSEAMFAERLASPYWMIALASGRHPDEESEFHDQNIVVADCHCLIPADTPDAERVAPLLDTEKGDDILRESTSLYARIRAALPQSVGLIDQIAVSRPFAHLRLAAEARHTALLAIKELPRVHPIEHMIGLAFCIQGVEVDGQEFDLGRSGHNSLVNIISLLINERSKRCPAKVIGRQRNQKVPVEFTWEGKVYQANLLVDWYYLDHQLSDVAPQAVV